MCVVCREAHYLCDTEEANAEMRICCTKFGIDCNDANTMSIYDVSACWVNFLLLRHFLLVISCIKFNLYLNLRVLFSLQTFSY